jgi:CelD/BcsL family acetyltransferase involved in cellulose biosynthesis
MRFNPDRAPERHLATKCRRAARRGRARLAKEGVTVRVDRVREPAEVRDLLPEVVALHRERDHALGRRSDLDPPSRRAFYLDMVRALAAAGQLDIWALRMDDALGAYVVGVRDGRSYRTLDARMADRWQAVSPGQILRTEMITRLLAEPGLAELDWMRGELRHKMQDATHVVAAEQLLAESSALVTSALQGWQSLRGQVRDRVPAQARRWLRSFHRPASRSPAVRARSVAGRAVPQQPDAADGNPARS